MAKEKNTRRCRLCGREFVPRNPGDRFCPGVCSMSANFIPHKRGPAEEMGMRLRRSSGTVEGIAKSRAKEEEKFGRVLAMFRLPIEKRWEVAKTFTPEEEAYSKKIQKRMLAEEKRITFDCSWSSYEEEESRGPTESDTLGESDDGSI